MGMGIVMLLATQMGGMMSEKRAYTHTQHYQKCLKDSRTHNSSMVLHKCLQNQRISMEYDGFIGASTEIHPLHDVLLRYIFLNKIDKT